MTSSSFLYCAEDPRGFIEHGQEVPHRVVGLNGVPERHVDDHRVDVASTVTPTGEVPGVHQVAHDGLGRTLGDAHRSGDVTRANGWVSIDADEHVRVVAQEGPVAPPALRSPFDVTHVRSRSKYRKQGW